MECLIRWIKVDVCIRLYPPYQTSVSPLSSSMIVDVVNQEHIGVIVGHRF